MAWLVLFVTKGRFLRHPFETIASNLTGRTVKVGGDFELYFAPVDVKFVAGDISVSNPGWAKRPQMFTASFVDTRLRTLPLLFGRRELRWLTLRDGQVDLEWDDTRKHNTWTFGDPKASGQPMQLPTITHASVTGTHIDYIDPQMHIVAGLDVAPVLSQGRRITGSIGFTGKGTMQKRPFTLSGSLISPNATIAGGANRLQLHADAAHTRLDLTGTLPGATQIAGAKLSLVVHGHDLADLFDFIGVAIPQTRDYTIRSGLTYDGTTWAFRRLKGRFGDSDIGGTLDIAMPDDRLTMKADLATRSLDMIDAGPFIGYNPDSLDQRGAKATVTQISGHPRLLPDAPLRTDAIDNFDARIHWHVDQVKNQDLPVSDIDLNLGLDHALLTMQPLTANIAGGKLTAKIALNARHSRVETAYDIRLSPTPMGKLLARFGVDGAGTTGTLSARIRMKGIGNSVHESLAHANGRIAIILPAGTFWTRNIQLAELDFGTFVQKMFEDKLKKPVQINCGLIGFTVRNGIAAADPILIDTRKNVILGRGGFSFRSEALDLAFRADAKTMSLFSGQSPVGLEGYFAAPRIDVISPELLARAGVGIGAGLLASPLAGILAFVDPGDAKSAACGPVLAGAHARAMRTTKGKPRHDVGNGTPAKSESGKQSAQERRAQDKKFKGRF